jgi:hypothetical protein
MTLLLGVTMRNDIFNRFDHPNYRMSFLVSLSSGPFNPSQLFSLRFQQVGHPKQLCQTQRGQKEQKEEDGK